MRVVLSSCAVTKIRNSFPSAAYVGFKYPRIGIVTLKQNNHLLIDFVVCYNYAMNIIISLRLRTPPR